jgi:hypothetical protein
MISLKRLESMRRWQREGGVAGRDIDRHAGWALRAGMLRIGGLWAPVTLIPTWALAPAIAKAEAEHARHRTEEMRDVHRRRAFDAAMQRSPEVGALGDAIRTDSWRRHCAYAAWWNGRRIHAWHSLRTWAYYDEVGDVDWERLAVKLDSGTVTGDNEDRKGRT